MEGNPHNHVHVNADAAVIAAGCFWGVEHMFKQAFEGKGMYQIRVGYVGGEIKEPSYDAVCTGSTGRECSLQKTLYKALLTWFS